MHRLRTRFGSTSLTTTILSSGTNRQRNVSAEDPEWFSLRPDVEKNHGYCHAVRIGNELKISGADSMDEKGFLSPEHSWGFWRESS